MRRFQAARPHSSSGEVSERPVRRGRVPGGSASLRGTGVLRGCAVPQPQLPAAAVRCWQRWSRVTHSTFARMCPQRDVEVRCAPFQPRCPPPSEIRSPLRRTGAAWAAFC